MSRNILIAFCVILRSLESSSLGRLLSELCTRIHKLFLPESCTTLSGESGDCVFLHKCPTLLEAFKRDRNNAPTVCHRESRRICCPLKFMVQPESSDKESDLNTRGSVPVEGRNESRVFDGPEIERRLFSIFSSFPKNKNHFFFRVH